MTIPTLARNAAMILRDGDINDESDRARFRAVKAELASLLPEGVDVSLVIEREVWGLALGDVLRTRAATPSGLSRFASSCQHRIAIAGEP